jgi:hypothetical protein
VTSARQLENLYEWKDTWLAEVALGGVIKTIEDVVSERNKFFHNIFTLIKIQRMILCFEYLVKSKK